MQACIVLDIPTTVYEYLHLKKSYAAHLDMYDTALYPVNYTIIAVIFTTVRVAGPLPVAGPGGCPRWGAASFGTTLSRTRSLTLGRSWTTLVLALWKTEHEAHRICTKLTLFKNLVMK